MTTNLSDKEQRMFNSIARGMDEPGSGWLHELTPFDGKVTSGVIASLTKKGLIISSQDGTDEDGIACFWVELVKS